MIIADDIKLYMFLPTNSSSGLNSQIPNYDNDNKEWISSHNILLNSSETILLNISHILLTCIVSYRYHFNFS